MRTPATGARMGACEPPPNRRPGLLPHPDSPSATSYRPTNGPVPPRPLTRPDPMGAETLVVVAETVGRALVGPKNSYLVTSSGHEPDGPQPPLHPRRTQRRVALTTHANSGTAMPTRYGQLWPHSHSVRPAGGSPLSGCPHGLVGTFRMRSTPTCWPSSGHRGPDRTEQMSGGRTCNDRWATSGPGPGRGRRSPPPRGPHRPTPRPPAAGYGEGWPGSPGHSGRRRAGAGEPRRWWSCRGPG
jgi:hypothetical protein